MPLSGSIGTGALRREKLRTARLYFVCDAQPHGEDPERRIDAALRGGVDIFQLREKELGSRYVELAANTARRLCDTYGALFLVNDDPELARSLGADGVHVGQDDVAPAEARRTLGSDALIGLSTHSPDQIDASVDDPVDYISVGPIWETPTKAGRPATGLDLVSYAASHSPHPFFAIGGIDGANIESVIAAGAHRVCVVRAIRDAVAPDDAATSLRKAFGREASPGG